MRYKAWRSNSDKRLFLICHDGAFDELPQPVRAMGPWTGSREGDIDRLKPAYRAMLAEQGFVVVCTSAFTFEVDAQT